MSGRGDRAPGRVKWTGFVTCLIDWSPSRGGEHSAARKSLGGNAQAVVAFELRKAARQCFAVGIEQRCRPRACGGVDALAQWDAARQGRPDDAGLDQAVIAGPSFVGIAIALDQARAFRDFERKIVRESCRLDDEAEPRFDRALLLLE